jgi:phosphatidylinositol 4-kinase A
MLLLSDSSPIADTLVQEAALKRTCNKLDMKICCSFSDIASAMATHLRQFITAPLPIFEFEFASETKAPPPLAAAAKCLALCIKVCIFRSPRSMHLQLLLPSNSWLQATT